MGGGLSAALGERSLHTENRTELHDYAYRVRSNDKQLKHLDLANRHLGVDGAQLAADTMTKNKVLISIDLSYNQLGGRGRKGRKTHEETEIGATHIVDALAHNTTLQILNLAGNNLGGPGTAAVSKLLSANNSIKELSLYNNSIDDSALQCLCRALSGNTGLAKLNLDYNDITDMGAAALCALFETNMTLTDISMKDNDGVSEQYIKDIQIFLERNRAQQDEEERLRLENQQRELQRLAAEEALRLQREQELNEQRSQIEREYRAMEEQKRREQAEQEQAEREHAERQQMLSMHREQKAREQEEHLSNLVNLAYAWRESLRGGARRGREWRSGFTTFKDTSYGLRETFEPPTVQEVLKRRLRACWCEPTEQTVMYAGQLHYHCINEPDLIDALDDKPRKYQGCSCTPHRCRSAPMSEVQKERTKDTLFGSTAPPRRK